MTPWLTLVGLGEDGRAGLSATALQALEEAVLVVGGARHLALIGPTPGTQCLWGSPLEDTFPAILAQRGRPVCVVASGDPFCYGVGATLGRLVPAAEMTCLPQPSAFSLMAARLGWALQDCETLTVHGRPLERVLRHLSPGARLLVLAWDGRTPAALAALLAARGFGASRLHVGEALGGPRERLRAAPADTFDLGDVDPLNTVAVDVVAGPGARVIPRAPGLPDSWFAHDGQITKARIRAVTLAALAPWPGATLWDIGAGSGSVGIEWMLAHPRNRALALEADPARVARIRQNARSLGVPDLVVQEGRAPEGLAGWPAPDAVFIGGGVTAPGLLDLACEAVKPGGRVVANVVTVEGQAVLAGAMARRGGDLCTLAVAQAEPVGRFHGWRPAMPVTQWVWGKP